MSISICALLVVILLHFLCFAGIILDVLVISFDCLLNQTLRFLMAIYTLDDL